MVRNTIMHEDSKFKTVLKEYFMLTVGTLIVTVGLYVFLIPNSFIMGGVTGISVMLSHVLPEGFPITTAGFATIFNILLLLVGFAFLGRDFGFKTVYTSILLSAVGMGIEYLGTTVYPGLFPLTDNLFLEMCVAVLLPGIGTAIIFYNKGSGGGTDVVAMIFKKYTRTESGRALLYVDFVIMLSAYIRGIEIGMLSTLGLFAKAMIIDKFIESLNRSKYFTIVTTYPDEVGDYINKVLHRGATMWKGMGVYTHEEKYILLVAMNTRQSKVVRDAIKKIDPHAFIVVDNTSDIVGNGFRAML